MLASTYFFLVPYSSWEQLLLKRENRMMNDYGDSPIREKAIVIPILELKCLPSLIFWCVILKDGNGSLVRGISLLVTYQSLPLGENPLRKWSIISLHTNSLTIFWQVRRRFENKTSSLVLRDQRSIQVIHPMDLLFNPFHLDGYSFQFNQWPIHSIVVPSLFYFSISSSSSLFNFSSLLISSPFSMHATLSFPSSSHSFHVLQLLLHVRMFSFQLSFHLLNSSVCSELHHSFLWLLKESRLKKPSGSCSIHSCFASFLSTLPILSFI